MKYRKLLLCAAIGVSMHSAYGMDNYTRRRVRGEAFENTKYQSIPMIDMTDVNNNNSNQNLSDIATLTSEVIVLGKEMITFESTLKALRPMMKQIISGKAGLAKQQGMISTLEKMEAKIEDIYFRFSRMKKYEISEIEQALSEVGHNLSMAKIELTRVKNILAAAENQV